MKKRRVRLLAIMMAAVLAVGMGSTGVMALANDDVQGDEATDETEGGYDMQQVDEAGDETEEGAEDDSGLQTVNEDSEEEDDSDDAGDGQLFSVDGEYMKATPSLFLDNDEEAYTGKEVSAEFEVQALGENGDLLGYIDSSTYTVSYTDNIEVGTATITVVVTAQDGSTVTLSDTFEIVDYGGKIGDDNYVVEPSFVYDTINGGETYIYSPKVTYYGDEDYPDGIDVTDQLTMMIENKEEGYITYGGWYVTADGEEVGADITKGDIAKVYIDSSGQVVIEAYDLSDEYQYAVIYVGPQYYDADGNYVALGYVQLTIMPNVEGGIDDVDDDSSDGTSPKTGDMNSTALWTALACMAAIAAGTAVVTRRRRV